MRLHRAAFSLLFLAGLALTLGLKARTMTMGTAPDIARFNRELAGRLTGQGFAVSIEDRAMDLDLVVAQRGDCAFKARLEETADRLQSLREFTSGLPVVRYRYRGEILGAFPRGRYDAYSLIDRIALRLGLAESTEWPLAIAARPECRLDAIDFGPQRLYRRQAA